MFAFDLHTKYKVNANFSFFSVNFHILIKCFKTLILSYSFLFRKLMNVWASNCFDAHFHNRNITRNSKTNEWIFVSVGVLHFWSGFVEHLFRWSHYMVNFQRKPCTFCGNKLIYIQYGRILAVGFFFALLAVFTSAPNCN